MLIEEPFWEALRVCLSGQERLVLPGEYSFCTSNVYKKKFTDTTSDWKPRHYVGSLPLQDNDAYDETIFTVERLPVRVD
jgi:hypothetical protein